MDEFGKAFADKGLRLGYHNHRFEFERWFDVTAYEYLFSNTRQLWAEPDCYWAQYGGADPAAWIRKLKGRVAEVHFKDMTVRNDQPIMAEVGEGNINWKGIIQACVEAGVRWYIVEQDLCERDPFESIRISIENLRRLGIQ
jgi:sugar phosphate isomerase/epimerase